MFYFFKLAKKELDDYLGSNVALFVLAVFFIIFICIRYVGFSRTQNIPLGWGMDVVFIYGSMVAIVLGLSSMYEEFGTKAINTLVSKPIYRDAVLNGKFLSALCIAFLVFVLSALIDSLLNLAFYGSTFINTLSEFFNVMPVFLVLYLLCFMAFYLITVFMFIVFKNSSVSLFLAFLSWVFIFNILPNMTFASYLSLICSGGHNQDIGNLISSLSPSSIVFNLNLMTAPSLVDAFNASVFDIVKMSLYVVILLVLCYIAFLRRDIQ